MADLFLNELEGRLHLPIPLGPFSRVLVNYHRNWLVDTESPDYLQKLEEADASYLHEYASSTGSRSRSLGAVTCRNYTQELNKQMGQYLLILLLI